MRKKFKSSNSSRPVLELPPINIKFSAETLDPYLLFLNTPKTYTLSSGKKIEYPLVSFDRSLQKGYEMDMFDSHDGYTNQKIEAKTFSIINFSVKIDNVEIGYTNVPDSLLFNIPQIYKSLNDLVYLATSCKSKETSSSSPSIISHQLASLTLCQLLPGQIVFEESNLSNQPDLFVTIFDKSFLVDVTTNNKFSDKRTKYNRLKRPYIIVDKYKILDMYKKEKCLNNLIKLSKVNDSRNSSDINEIIAKQNINSVKSIYDKEILDFFLNIGESSLNYLSDIVNQCIAEDYMHSVSKVEEKKFLFKSDHLETFTESMNADSSTLDWLKFNLIEKVSNKMIKPIHISLSLKVINDILELEESDVYQEAYHADLEEEKSLFNPYVDKILMDSRSIEHYQSYRNQTSDRYVLSKYDEEYYTSQVKQFSVSRNESYFDIIRTGKIKLNTEGRIVNNCKPKYIIYDHMELRNISKIIPETPFREVMLLESPLDVLTNNKPIAIDPLDRELIGESKHNLVKYLESSKLYHILTLFRRTSYSILHSFKKTSGQIFSVQHPRLELFTHVLLTGNPAEVDKGFAYVSLVIGKGLIRTWKWTNVDIKSFSIATFRLINCLKSIWDLKIEEDMKERMSDLYLSIIFENSWGLSRLLKPFRYLCCGWCYNSPLVQLQLDKFKEEYSLNQKSYDNKMSIFLMKMYLTDSSEPGKTPLFGLSEKDIGYEAFLMNLCPSQTIGKRRHRVNMSLELIKEIELYETHSDLVVNHYKSFKHSIPLIKSLINVKDSFNLKLEIKRYLLDIRNISERTKGRFTSSPISILSIWKSVRELSISNIYSSSHLRNLMTMKSSFDPINFKKCSALESISTLSSHYNLGTTSTLAIDLITNVNDLTYRMFDKDQIGGDREISILSSEFRILQSICENYSREVGRKTGIDMLDNPDKEKLYCNAHNQCGDGIRLTADQTRWGPNFNTSHFGYLMALLSRRSTEAFMPMIVCFKGEFKIFEMTNYPELAKYQKLGYTLPGLLAPSHMGQGIFHYTSSLYHSLVHKTMGEIVTSIVSPKMDLFLRYSHFITSDDVAQFWSIEDKSGATLTPSKDIEKRKYEKLIIRLLKGYNDFLTYYCILTSKYKNMISRKSIEFNSIFLNKDSVGSNSPKFLYSLCDPATSGNKLRDLRNMIDIFSDGLNSGLTVNESFYVLQSNLCYRLLQWGSNFIKIIGILRIILENLCDRNGNCLPEKVISLTSRVTDKTNERSNNLNCNTVLPFRRYGDMVKGLNSYIKVLKMETEIAHAEHKRDTLELAKERKLGSNRGIVLSKRLKEKSRIEAPLSCPFNCFEISSEAYLNVFLNTGGEGIFYKPDRRISINPSLVEIKESTGFKHIWYRRSLKMSLSLDELIVSSYPRVNYVTSKSSDLDMILHISRSKNIAKISLKDDIVNGDYETRLAYFDDLMTSARITGNTKQITYIDQEIKYLSVNFENLVEMVEYTCSVRLLKSTLNNHIPKTPDRDLYCLSNRFEEKISHTGLVMCPALNRTYDVNTDIFELRLSSLIKASHEILLREKRLYSTTDRSYLNITILVKVKEKQMDQGELVFGGYETDSIAIGNSSIEEIDLLDVISGLMENYIMTHGSEELSGLFDINSSVNDYIPQTDLSDVNSQASVDEQLPEFNFEPHSHHVYSTVISVEVSDICQTLNQPWFRNEVKLNAILGQLIEDNFIHDQCDNQSIYSLWTQFKTKSNIQNNELYDDPMTNNIKYDIFLTAYFNIINTINNCSRATNLVSFSNDDLACIKEILTVSDDHLSYGLKTINGLPSCCSLTKDPVGKILNSDDALHNIFVSGIIDYLE